MTPSTILPRGTREAEIKAIIINELRKRQRISDSAIIADEYQLAGTGVRADLAIQTKTKIIGIEIKSEFDSLRRLRRQVEVYQKYFDRTLLLVSRKHLTNISPSDFPNVEFWSLDKENILKKLSSPTAKKNQASPPYLSLLTKVEMRKYEGLKISDKQKLMQSFKDRYGETSATFWLHVGRGLVTTDHLALLSRFRSMRSLNDRIKEEKKSQVEAWASAT